MSYEKKGKKFMIARYTRDEMFNLWSEHNKYNTWLKIEILALEAYNKLGKVPKTDLELIKNKAYVNTERILELEKETKHDVVAFTKAVAENFGKEGKWIHYGLTSTDVVDTALSYRLKQANIIISNGLNELLHALKERAIEHKYTVMMGRTHGVHAQPTTFGLKMALFYEETKRNINRFNNAKKQIEVGKLSGSVGNFADVPPFVEEYVCKNLGLLKDPISTQTLQRDRHAYYMSVIALIASSIEKMAIEFRHLQKTETNEVSEGFLKGQAGSSSMPHKKNPIGCENMAGLARVIRGHMFSAYENIPLWHERDISHSSAERIIFPDATSLLDYMLHRFTQIVKNLNVNKNNMRKNIDITKGLVFSQQVLHLMIDQGLSRDEAYNIVQPLALVAHEHDYNFKEILLQDERIMKILTSEQIESAFSLSYYIKEVDTIFERVFLD